MTRVPALPDQVAGWNRVKEMGKNDAWGLRYGNMGTYSGKPGKPLARQYFIQGAIEGHFHSYIWPPSSLGANASTGKG